MPTFVIFFLIGIILSTLVSTLPNLFSIILIFCLSIALFFSKKILKYFAVMGVGYSWAIFYAYTFTSFTLPHSLENKPISIIGYISSIPIKNQASTAFSFLVTNMQGKSCHFKIHLSWYQNPYSLRVGDCWNLVVKLKRPHSLMNESSFDLEKSYFQNHLRALGSVVRSSKNYYLGATKYFTVEKSRQYFFDLIASNFKEHRFFGIVLALTLGITNYITVSQWEVFRATGTNHLVAISGLHIGLIATMSAKLCGLFWNRFPNAALILPIPKFESCVGVLTAIIYSYFAGLSASTQRSLIMITVVMVSNLSQRNISTFRSLIISLGIILMINPFVILGAGFWLSFIAVGLLIYGMNARLFAGGIWWKWGRAQWVVSLGMIPSVIAFFQQTSALSIPANIIAIPWISFLVVPCCILGAVILFFSNSLGLFILNAAMYLLQPIWYFLENLTKYKFLILHYSFPSNLINLLSHVAAYVTLLPSGMLHRLVAMIWWLPLLFAKSLSPVEHLELTVFDVGQGLATLVRTQHHTLIYDTGAKINNNFDMGKIVIVPYLLSKKIRQIDILTVSHGDNDHIGGAESILNSVKVNQIMTSVPARFKPYTAKFCDDSMEWKWDGVSFKFLSPKKSTNLKGNNASCVLKITNDNKSILLTGDIEKSAERILLQTHKKELYSTILIAPHHGSKTSSSKEFLDAVKPKYTIISYGYLNSYHHPHQEVINRYQARKTVLLNTVLSGAITMTLGPDSDIVVKEYRKLHHKIWHQD